MVLEKKSRKRYENISTLQLSELLFDHESAYEFGGEF